MSLLSISATVQNVPETVERLNENGSQAWERLKAAMEIAADELYSEMRTEMEGQIDDSHGHIAKALFRKVESDDSAMTVTATVGVGHRAFYGAILNVGVAKRFDVKSYIRQVKGSAALQGRRRKTVLSAGTVQGYPRTLIIEAHPFIQQSFRNIQDVLSADIEDAVRRAVTDGS